MSSISSYYIVVEKVIEPPAEGYQTVAVQDSSIYKGRIVELPDSPIYISNHKLELGDVVIFAKYSPDTHEIEDKKFVRAEDLLKVL